MSLQGGMGWRVRGYRSYSAIGSSDKHNPAWCAVQARPALGIFFSNIPSPGASGTIHMAPRCPLQSRTTERNNPSEQTGNINVQTVHSAPQDTHKLYAFGHLESVFGAPQGDIDGHWYETIEL